MMGDLKSTLLYKKTLGCLLGGLIGDAMGTPTEGKDYREIEKNFGWVEDFNCDGTDDTVMKNLLSEALIRTEGYATLDDWAKVWLDNWEAIFGVKVGKFFISVLHTANKIKRHSVPRMAALGNMPSSSSAMCISPVGIVNACNPRQAALQAYNLASLIHIHDVGFCQDGAASMAAAVAEAFKPDATVDSVLESAMDAIIELSGREMLGEIEGALNLAREKRDYKRFREAVYNDSKRFFHPLICDSRETIPLTLALFYLAGGDVERCITYGANFGRDADTIASMCGAIAGALRGIDGFRKEWIEKVNRYANLNQEELAENLAGVAIKKYKREREAQKVFERIAREG
ncbi:MAG: ADP-ribosylglycohydrolase family protein [bacterium]